MPAKPMFIKTIVTSELFRKIVESNKGTCLDVLTGFKYIGEKIAQWEEDKKADVAAHHYIFGGEESYGYLYGTHSRDKDAIVSAALIADAALHMKLQGKTLIDLLYEIYHKHGVYREKLLSVTLEGKEGAEKIVETMLHLRSTPLKTIGGLNVTVVEDYLNHTHTSLETGKTESIVLPKSNVLRYWLSDGTKLVIRPSGTEPKIKLYAGVFDDHFVSDAPHISEVIQKCDKRAEEMVNSLSRLIFQR